MCINGFSRRAAVPILIAGVALCSPLPAAAQPGEALEIGADGPVIRILAPPGRRAEGRTEIETLLIDPEVREVVFYLDGSEVARRGRPPWNAKLKLASPPREQTLKVEALGRRDRVLGEDEVVLNRAWVPFRARLTAIEGDHRAGPLAVRAEVSVPRKASLERVDFFLGEQPAASFTAPPFAAELELSGDPGFVRVVARLADGREVEDVQVLGAAGLAEEVDVNLVQLQTLVTEASGAPVRDLEAADFEIRQGGEVQVVDRLYQADDVALVLGLVIDSSGSMAPIWNTAVRAAREFLGSAVEARDRAFLVDFNTRLELAHPLTGNTEDLVAALAEITPEGGTALFDSMLYSLLQFEDEPGRRALVLVTDGFDSSSTTDPRRAVELARKLGVPIYVIALQDRAAGPGAGLGIGQGYSVHELKLITEPTGGRLLRIGSGQGMARAFAQIAADLRHQVVLTYYTDALPGDGKQEVKVRVPGRKGVEVRAVYGLDQVH